MVDFKKRKLVETSSGDDSASKDEFSSLLDQLPKAKLVDLLGKLASQYPSVAEEIKSFATADPPRPTPPYPPVPTPSYVQMPPSDPRPVLRFPRPHPPVPTPSYVHMPPSNPRPVRSYKYPYPDVSKLLAPPAGMSNYKYQCPKPTTD